MSSCAPCGLDGGLCCTGQNQGPPCKDSAAVSVNGVCTASTGQLNSPCDPQHSCSKDFSGLKCIQGPDSQSTCQCGPDSKGFACSPTSVCSVGSGIGPVPSPAPGPPVPGPAPSPAPGPAPGPVKPCDDPKATTVISKKELEDHGLCKYFSGVCADKGHCGPGQIRGVTLKGKPDANCYVSSKDGFAALYNAYKGAQDGDSFCSITAPP
jgi:hypothetical protein